MTRFVTTLLYYLKNRPVFLLLMPAFFVLDGLTRNYGAVQAGDALLLMLFYIGVALLLTGIAWLFFRNAIKAALFTFVILAFQFFFGSLQDFLKESWPAFQSVRYRHILIVALLSFIMTALWLRRKKKPPVKPVYYLNVLFLVFIFISTISLTDKRFRNNRAVDKLSPLPNLAVCDTCAKPDIYLIVPDQYTGNSALQKLFNYNNAAFEQELANRGFHIAPQSQSNYNLTPFSIASMLNMDYVGLQRGRQTEGAISYCYQLIRNSRVLKYLQGNQYRFYNCSVFDFEGQPAHEYGAFLPYGAELITSQTLTSRFEKDMRHDILTGRFGLKKLQEKYAYEYMHFNDSMITLTKYIAMQPSDAPKFVYTHVMMPHYPYYFDSTATPLPLHKLTGIRNAGVPEYVGYLRYTNKRLLELVDHIRAHSARPPAIMLLSDHGFRHPEIKTNGQYDFVNLNAIWLPNKDYTGFYAGVTNVNHFRIFFNTCFHQHIPLLADSTINVWD